jgi:hypothetical protein
MLLANPSFRQANTLIVVACFKALAAVGVLGLSLVGTAQFPGLQQRELATFVRVTQSDPLCHQIVFDNDSWSNCARRKRAMRSDGSRAQF